MDYGPRSFPRGAWERTWSIIHNLNSQSRHRYFNALSEISLRHQAPSQRMHFTAL
jgi:hypothetical protein